VIARAVIARAWRLFAPFVPCPRPTCRTGQSILCRWQ